MAGESLSTITVTGPGGDVVINERDFGFYSSQGYKLQADVKKSPEPAPTFDLATLEKMDVPSLKLTAEKLGITGFESMKKAELVPSILEKSSK